MLQVIVAAKNLTALLRKT